MGIKSLTHYDPKTSVHIAPLVVFRILFGSVMLWSILRFIAKGWIEIQYLSPTFFFSYYGFEYVQVLGKFGMYTLFFILVVAAIGILLGCCYRLSSISFFLIFTYVELIDKTNYLNHYYFVSVISFMLMFVPAHRYFSVDVWRKPELKITHIPRWMIDVFKLQLFFVYFFAGLAKINADWLFRAMPLAIWLPPKADLPLIGWLFKYKITPYLFSWLGAIYDLSIAFLLLIPQTRFLAYLAIIAFHLLTAILFPIGMFPFIMMLCTLIFFSEKWHLQRINQLKKGLFNINQAKEIKRNLNPIPRWIIGILSIHIVVQLLLPLRFLAYPDSLFWTEEGYRFSWRVMLMEKEGETIFHVKNPDNQEVWEVYNLDYLSPLQEKMMATQPDMILQFAHHLEKIYQQKGIRDPKIYATSYVSLNGRKSRPFIDSSVDLTQQKEGFHHKTWILPF